MWNIDIETRIHDLDAEAEERHARLLDTMTETDGSAKTSLLAPRRVLERLRNAFGRPNACARAVRSCPAPLVQGK